MNSSLFTKVFKLKYQMNSSLFTRVFKLSNPPINFPRKKTFGQNLLEVSKKRSSINSLWPITDTISCVNFLESKPRTTSIASAERAYKQKGMGERERSKGDKSMKIKNQKHTAHFFFSFFIPLLLLPRV